GQVLLSRTTRDLVEDELPAGVTLVDLGERRLKDLDRPEALSQLVIEGLQSEFAPLRTLDEELRKKRRRMYLGSAAIGVLAAAIALPVFPLGRGSSPSQRAGAPNSPAAIASVSNRLIGSVPVGIRPAALAAGASSIWVVNVEDQTISRIDPTQLTLQRTIPLT